MTTQRTTRGRSNTDARPNSSDSRRLSANTALAAVGQLHDLQVERLDMLRRSVRNSVALVALYERWAQLLKEEAN